MDSSEALNRLCNSYDRMDIIMKEINRKHDILISMMTALVEDGLISEEKQVEGSVVIDDLGYEVTALKSEKYSLLSQEKGGYEMGLELPKIDLPEFGGEEPREWLRIVGEIFHVHRVLDDHKLGIAKEYLTGKAYIWYQGFIYNNPASGWELFSTELYRRFADNVTEIGNIAEEEVETFSKIKQTGALRDNHERFEDLKSQVMMALPCLPQFYYIANFTSGLEEDIRSITALDGNLSPITMRVLGQIKRKRISILIDNGSNHSFIDETLVQDLGNRVDRNRLMVMTVANGQKLEKGAVCNPHIWQMQGLEFQYEMRTLKLGGSDMVLGKDWLSQFSPLIFDFTQRCIFQNKGEEVELHSEYSGGKIEMIGVKQMNQVLDTYYYEVTYMVFQIEPAQYFGILQVWPTGYGVAMNTILTVEEILQGGQIRPSIEGKLGLSVYSMCNGMMLSQWPFLGTITLCSTVSILLLFFKAYLFTVKFQIQAKAAIYLSRQGQRHHLIKSWGMAVLFFSSTVFTLGHIVVVYSTSCKARRKLLLHRVDP